jgi:hypothetical protein
MPKVAIVPSTQFHNQYCCANVIEGQKMGEYGRRVTDLINQFGAPGIQAKCFWNQPSGGDDYVGNTDAATAWGADYLVSFHTDSAGDQDNDGRGYTGSLLCYSSADPEGRRLGQRIQSRMTTDFRWPIAGEQDRKGTLYVLDDFSGPSCLVELGNHSDPQDCRALIDQAEQFCQAIAWGIFNYLGTEPKRPGAQTKEDDMPAPFISANEASRKWGGFVRKGQVIRAIVLLGKDAGVPFDSADNEINFYRHDKSKPSGFEKVRGPIGMGPGNMDSFMAPVEGVYEVDSSKLPFITQLDPS